MESTFTRKTILLMTISLVAGFFLNYWSTKLANDKLLDQLKAELALINKAQTVGRGTALDGRKMQLEAQIAILSGN